MTEVARARTKALRVTGAYDDRQSVWDLVRTHSPYAPHGVTRRLRGLPRPDDVGHDEDWLPDGVLPPGALLRAGDDGDWVITDEGGEPVRRYRAGAVRVSLLWKAVVFRDGAENVSVRRRR